MKRIIYVSAIFLSCSLKPRPHEKMVQPEISKNTACIEMAFDSSILYDSLNAFSLKLRNINTQFKVDSIYIVENIQDSSIDSVFALKYKNSKCLLYYATQSSKLILEEIDIRDSLIFMGIYCGIDKVNFTKRILHRDNVLNCDTLLLLAAEDSEDGSGLNFIFRDNKLRSIYQRLGTFDLVYDSNRIKKRIGFQ